MATTSYWGINPKTGGLSPLDEEELAVAMWERTCKIQGLPLDTPYKIKDATERMTWSEMTCDRLWRNVYWKRSLENNPSKVTAVINMKKNFIQRLKKKVAEEDLDEFEITQIGKMVKKTQEDLEELMNRDDEDAPKMKKKKKEEDGDEPVVFDDPELAKIDKHLRKRKAEGVDYEAAAAAIVAAAAAATCF